jgi:hypothetical protein
MDPKQVSKERWKATYLLGMTPNYYLIISARAS